MKEGKRFIFCISIALVVLLFALCSTVIPIAFIIMTRAIGIVESRYEERITVLETQIDTLLRVRNETILTSRLDSLERITYDLDVRVSGDEHNLLTDKEMIAGLINRTRYISGLIARTAAETFGLGGGPRECLGAIREARDILIPTPLFPKQQRCWDMDDDGTYRCMAEASWCPKACHKVSCACGDMIDFFRDYGYSGFPQTKCD